MHVKGAPPSPHYFDHITGTKQFFDLRRNSWRQAGSKYVLFKKERHLNKRAGVWTPHGYATVLSDFRTIDVPYYWEPGRPSTWCFMAIRSLH